MQDEISKDQIWLIGASHGIGQALAIELASQGHQIALSSRSEEALQGTLELMAGQDHLVIPMDVTQPEQISAAIQQIKKTWPRFNRVLFFAGVYTPTNFTESHDPQAATNTVQVNLLGAMHTVGLTLPHLLQQVRPQIALCGSVSGYRGLPNSQPYGATKAGLINYCQSLDVELGDQIDIKLINPGFVSTRLTDKNDFEMPMKISPEQAAKHIAAGLNKKSLEVHFPKTFTYLIKLITKLPRCLYTRLLRRA